MWKPLVGSVVLSLCLAFSCTTARAQTTITLDGGSCPACFNFAVSGASVTMTMPSSTSFIAVTALGSGAPFIPTVTDFTLSESAPIMLTYAGTGDYNAALGNVGSFIIDLTGTGAFSGFTLDGVLSIQNLSQSGSSGTFNTSVLGNFDITGGTYCGETGAVCGPGAGYGKVYLTLGTSTPPVTNGSHGGLSSGSIVIPATDIATTPEPSSILLFGTGLLAFGAVLRRRSLHS